MSESQSIVDVSAWPPIRIEQMGSKVKDWRVNPADPDRTPWLFKAPRPNTGEHWAEVAAAGAAALLRVPHAEVSLARSANGEGVICRSLTWNPNRNRVLVHGNEVLRIVDKNYPEVEEGFTPLPEHTPRRVMEALGIPGIRPPRGHEDDSRLHTAADHFLGYLLLDAWIGNTDRHHENWGLIMTAVANGPNVVELSPTYDHGSALGRELTDARRREHLDADHPHRGIARYAAKATSRFYPSAGGTKPLTAIAAFREAAEIRPTAAACWLDRLRSVDDTEIQAMLARIPRPPLSETGLAFATAMMNEQRSQLLTP